MKPATTAKRNFEKTKMMIVDPSFPTQISHRTVADLKTYLRAGDLLIVNTASTLPASFKGIIKRSNESVEIRLAAFIGTSAGDLRHWSALSFGAGNWRLTTEERDPAPELRKGDSIEISPGLSAVIKSVAFSRLLKIEFQSSQLVRDLYREGRPIQYSYHEGDLEIWDQQTVFHGPPVSVEPPSAAFPLT